MAEFSSRLGKEMSEAEARSVLSSEDHGVLSMGIENRGYGLPMAYSYDEEADRLVLGFVSTPESKKQRFATDTEEVTLTVYTYEDVDSWESVIVTGSIEPIPEPDVSDRLIPVFFVEENDTGDRRFVQFDDFERQWYELHIDDVSGRSSGWP